MGSEALRVDHIGSTSVPDLAAKDLIDIQITVETLVDNVPATASRSAFAVRATCWTRPMLGNRGDEHGTMSTEIELDQMSRFQADPLG